MFNGVEMYNAPTGVTPSEKPEKIEKFNKELMEEFLKCQERMKEIVAELERRKAEGKNISSDDQFALDEAILFEEIGIPEEIKAGEENREDEFSDQRIEELEEIIVDDDYKKRSLEFLEKEGVVKYKDGQVYFDMNIFESKDFSDKFYLAYFGKRDGVGRKGSKQEVYKMFDGVKVIGLSDDFIKENEPQKLSEFIYNNSLEKIKDRFFDKLISEKVIEEKEGYKVFDIDKFNNLKLSRKLGVIDGESIYSSRNVLFGFLKDLKVVSKDDYLENIENKNELKPISLLNVPESIEEAYDTNSIKNKEYYLNFWDIRNKENEKRQIKWQRNKDFKASNGESINLQEFYLVTSIFRDFNGKRENGILMVDNPKTKQRQPIAYDWLSENSLLLPEMRQGIHGFLQKNCKDSLEQGVLKLEDFKIKTTGDSGKILRKEFLPEKGKSFSAFIKGVSYYISKGNYFIHDDKKIPIENIKVVVLDEKTAGIISTINGVEKLEYTIDLLSDEEIQEKKEELKERDGENLSEEEMKGRITLMRKGRGAKFNQFSLSSIIMKKAGESNDDYMERVSQISNYNHVKDVSDNLLKECQVSIHNLSWREQVWLSAAEHELRLQNRYDGFIDFTKKYGLDGLRTFLSCEQDIAGAGKLLEINKKFDQEQAEKIFSRYAKIQSDSRRLEETMKNSEFFDNQKMSQEIKQKLRGNLYDAFVSRATDILSTAYLIAQKGEAKVDFYNGKEIKVTKIEEVIEALDVYEEFMEKMKGFFAKEGRYQFDYTSSVDQGELSAHNFLVDDKETGEKSYSTVTIRGNGTNEHMKDFEYDGEARVNFLFSDEPIAMDISNKSRKEATTFRLDRECITLDETGKNVLSKDNTRQDGRLSLDFGSIYEDSGRKNSVLGRVMSVGNAYVAAEKKQKAEYYHNKEAFYEDLGKADVFRQIVETMEDFIQSKYVNKLSIENRKAA